MRYGREVPKPDQSPIGLVLTRTARAVSRAFDARLVAAGGSLPVWLILLALRTRETPNQRELAAAVGIQGATLTHHLNGMEDAGLLTRRRDPQNRRVHLVELTPAGAGAVRAAAVGRGHPRRAAARRPVGDRPGHPARPPRPDARRGHPRNVIGIRRPNLGNG